MHTHLLGHVALLRVGQALDIELYERDEALAREDRRDLATEDAVEDQGDGIGDFPHGGAVEERTSQGGDRSLGCDRREQMAVAKPSAREGERSG